MATKMYDDIGAFHEAARMLRDRRGVPLDPPHSRGEMFLGDELAIHLGLEDSDVGRTLAMNGSFEPTLLERAREHVRSTVSQAQAFTEQHLAQALAAKGRGHAEGEMSVELDVVRAGQQWLMRHGDPLERKVYGAIWGNDFVSAEESAIQRELFEPEVQWVNAAYIASGHEPPLLAYRAWSTVLDAAAQIHVRKIQDRVDHEMEGYDPTSDPDEVAARSIYSSLSVSADEADREGSAPLLNSVLAAVAQARLSVRRGIADFGDERPEVADQLRRADRALSNAVEALRPEQDDDLDELDEDEWTVTPERALGAWIETTTRLRTLIDTEQYTALRNAIRETDSYLHDYTSGGTPPGSFEEEDLYLDALNRATVPIPSSAPEQVLTEMRARGERVPDFPDPKEVASTSDVRGLHVSELQRALTRPGKSPTPRTHESVVFARAWRASTKQLDEDLVVSYDVPDAPGQALVERLDGNLDSYVSAMRTGRNEVTLNDAIGNEVERAELGERLGLDESGVVTVMTGLVEGLEAAENMRHAPTDSAGPTAAPTSIAQSARQASTGSADPLRSAHLQPHSPTSTNSPSRS